MSSYNFDNLEFGKIYFFSDEDSKSNEKVINLLQKHLSVKYRFYDLRFKIEVIETADREMKGIVAARRFNIGNIGNYSVLTADSHYDSCMSQFIDVLFDIKSTKRESFERIEPKRHASGSIKYDICLEDMDFMPKRDIKESRESYKIAEGFFHKDPTFGLDCFASLRSYKASKEDVLLKKAEAEEDQAIDENENEKVLCLNKISELILFYMAKFKEVPPVGEIEKLCKERLTLEAEEVSRIEVNTDMKVLLPDYNNVEFKFSPLLKTLYILFLNHPEGIVLKNISDYKDEIEMIYEIIMPNRDDNMFNSFIENLLDTTSGSLVQKISKINRLIQSVVIHSGIRENYIIKGTRGKEYKISLNRELVTMHAALKP